MHSEIPAINCGLEASLVVVLAVRAEPVFIHVRDRVGELSNEVRLFPHFLQQELVDGLGVFFYDFL